MGRPLFGNTHSPNCPCAHCAADIAVAPAHPIASAQSADDQPTQLPRTSQDVSPATILQTIAETQASLSRASSAIEAAYTRILTLRTRLRQNREAMSLLSQTAPRMGPNHSAIVLSASTPETRTPTADGQSMPVDSTDPSRDQTRRSVQSDLATPSRQRLETIRRRFQELAGSEPNTDTNQDLAAYPEWADPSHTPTRASSGGSVNPRRLSSTSQSYIRRDPPSFNETATSNPLRRRVDARAAAAQNLSRNFDDTASRIMELTSSIDTYISRLHRHGEELVAATSSLRSGGDPRLSAPSAPGPTVSGTNRRLLTSQQLRQELMNTVDELEDVSWGPPPLRRDSANDTRVAEVNGLAVPGTFDASPLTPRLGPRVRRPLEGNRAPPPLFFDPSDSEDDDELDLLLSQRPRRVHPPAPSARHRAELLGRARAALLSGRRGAGDVPEGPVVTIQRRPSLTQSERYDLAMAASQSVSQSEVRQRRRRRGWARLDRDGNEVPTDEEEEYERNRAHMRARAQALVGGTPSILSPSVNQESTTLPPPPPPDHQRYSYIFTPTTRNDLPSEQPSGYDSTAVRVRLSPRTRESTSPSGLRVRQWQRAQQRADPAESTPVSTPIETTTGKSSYSYTTPFHASPIPWSQVDLTPPSRTNNRRTSKIRATLRGPLAGR